MTTTTTYKIELTEDEFLVLSDAMIERLSYLEDIKMRYIAEVKSTQRQPKEMINSTRQRIFTYQKNIDDIQALYNKFQEVSNSK